MKHSKYAMFELLVLIFGAGTVFVLILSSPWQTPVEITAQLLLIPILVGVLHYGRKGGLVTFPLASAVYLAIRVPDIIKIGLVGPIFQLLIVRVLVYGVVGIGGGMICSRIKYLFARLERQDLIDDVTSLYNPNYLAQLIERYEQEFKRYQNPFSVAILKIDSKAFNKLKEAQLRTQLREMGSTIRNNTRAVDEVGRVSNTEFGLIFPYTNASRATVAGKRIQKLVANYLKKQRYFVENDVKIRLEIFGYLDDKRRLRRLRRRLATKAF
ncbi:MAG: diguanylate cyclase [Actinomycetota bacterium]|nr:diguanylate cyclase [Actinomycetota bacterium]